MRCVTVGPNAVPTAIVHDEEAAPTMTILVLSLLAIVGVTIVLAARA